MDILTIATISHEVGRWTNVFLWLFTAGLVASGSLWLADRLRDLARQLLLDAVQIYVGWQQARLDLDRQRAEIAWTRDVAPALLVRQQKALLADIKADRQEIAELASLVTDQLNPVAGLVLYLEASLTDLQKNRSALDPDNIETRQRLIKAGRGLANKAVALCNHSGAADYQDRLQSIIERANKLWTEVLDYET